MKKVIVGLSGGVDSAVSAYLLKQQGYEVIALFMKNWEEEGEVCPLSNDYEDALSICETLNIPLYTVNFVKEYWERVFSSFLEGLKKGLTPNPDILCNREIKFKAFFHRAKELGADYLATGHYCRTQKGKLFKGSDPNKDQSYFLYTLKSDLLSQVLFPIGDLPKSTVREIAKSQGLSNHDKKDSTGICFIGKRNFKQFISRYIPYQTGHFENTQGDIIGKHDGAAYYTIGQRKGLGIGGEGKAWFVVGKDIDRNVVIVEQGEDHSSLYSRGLIAKDLSWVNEDWIHKQTPFQCYAKIRYRQQEVPCEISINKKFLNVVFKEPQRAIAPDQAVVFYIGEECLGGATIEKAL